MADIAEQSGNFVVERHMPAEGDAEFDIINLLSAKTALHEGLFGQLVVHADVKDFVTVYVRAARWHQCQSPSFETYASEAKALIGPLLSAFNREAGTRYRMVITSKESLEPKLPTQSERLFKRFATLANRSSLHPSDWGRFYQFVSNIRMRKPPSDDDISRLLINEGFAERHAQRIAEVYGHLLAFKNRSRQWRET